jgi:carboxypeptidase T
LKYAAKVANAPFKTPKGPDVMKLGIQSTTSNSVTVKVDVSDVERSKAYGGLNGQVFAATGSQPIKMVRMFVDEHPYTSQNTGKLMNPLDGVFNSPTESASLNTGVLSPGRHVLYVAAEDEKGYKGPISAAFFTIDYCCPSFVIH